MGGTGLGKTHLLHAIGNGILANKPNARVLYIHANNFMQHMVKAMRDNKWINSKNSIVLLMHY